MQTHQMESERSAMRSSVEKIFVSDEVGYFSAEQNRRLCADFQKLNATEAELKASLNATHLNAKPRAQQEALAQELERVKTAKAMVIEELLSTNKKLIYSYLKHIFPDILERWNSELMQACAEGIARAARTYNPQRGEFSSYAVPCMKHEVFRLIKRMKRQEKEPLMEDLSVQNEDGLNWEETWADPNELPVEEIVAHTLLVESLQKGFALVLAKLDFEEQALVQKWFACERGNQANGSFAASLTDAEEKLWKKTKRKLAAYLQAYRE